eukprot:scaffold84692_cov66-Phaeocystis_antarctica.AAC.6
MSLHDWERAAMWSIGAGHTHMDIWHRRRCPLRYYCIRCCAATGTSITRLTHMLTHQLLGQRDHLIPVVGVRVVAPEKLNCTREGGGLVVLDRSATVVQKEHVQQGHGQWPQHDEADREGYDRLVCAISRALNVERSCQVGLGLARKVVKTEALALKGEEERARH